MHIASRQIEAAAVWRSALVVRPHSDTMLLMIKNSVIEKLPPHPSQRNMDCPLCGAGFTTIPIRRGRTPENLEHVVEQHVCPSGHVFQTEIGQDEMLA